MSLKQAQDASGMCLRPSMQQLQAQLEERDQQLQSVRVCMYAKLLLYKC